MPFSLDFNPGAYMYDINMTITFEQVMSFQHALNTKPLNCRLLKEKRCKMENSFRFLYYEFPFLQPHKAAKNDIKDSLEI